MGADWREMTWWQYQALLDRWNAHHSDDKPSGGASVPPDRMRGYLDARAATE